MMHAFHLILLTLHSNSQCLSACFVVSAWYYNSRRWGNDYSAYVR